MNTVLRILSLLLQVPRTVYRWWYVDLKREQVIHVENQITSADQIHPGMIIEMRTSAPNLHPSQKIVYLISEVKANDLGRYVEYYDPRMTSRVAINHMYLADVGVEPTSGCGLPPFSGRWHAYNYIVSHGAYDSVEEFADWYNGHVTYLENR